MDDEFNMSLRKFLKQVGVTSQQAIEEAVRDTGATDTPLRAKMVLTVEGLDLTHVIEGTITGPKALRSPDTGQLQAKSPIVTHNASGTK